MNFETREQFFMSNWSTSKAGNLWCRVDKTTYTLIEQFNDAYEELPNGDMPVDFKVVVVSPKGERKEFSMLECVDYLDAAQKLWPFGREKPLTVEEIQ